jgi:hypothetical protein
MEEKMLNRNKSIIGLLGAGMLTLSLAACSTPAADTNTGTTSSPSSSSSASSDVTPTPVASISSLTGVDTKVTVDAGFLDALTSLGVAPGTVGSATLTDGVLAFPITGGNVDYYDPAEDYRPYVQGSIEHTGSGLSLTAGDKVVELTDFRIDPGTSQLFGTVTVDGAVAAEDAFLFNLDGTTLQPLQDNGDGTATLQGTRVLISEDAAPLLNDTFGITDIQPDMLVGIASITVNTGA